MPKTSVQECVGIQKFVRTEVFIPEQWAESREGQRKLDVTVLVVGPGTGADGPRLRGRGKSKCSMSKESMIPEENKRASIMN